MEAKVTIEIEIEFGITIEVEVGRCSFIIV